MDMLTLCVTEFKEIRKEWKARKKEEENNRKQEEERHRQAAAQAAAQNGSDPQGPDGAPSTYPGSRAVQLPPIGYQSAQYPAPPGSAGVPQQPLPDYGNSHMYSNYPPHSPYGQPPPSQGMYSQCKSYPGRDAVALCTDAPCSKWTTATKPLGFIRLHFMVNGHLDFG